MVDNREVHIYALKAIEKIRQSKIGTKHSIEFKEAMSKRLKGVPLSEESKRKRSESIKLWWAKRKSIEDIVKS